MTARRRWAWAAAAVAALPLVELVVVLAVGRSIGGWQTLALLVVTSAVGVVVLRREGRATWRAFTAAAADGRAPGTEVADGALVLVGGLLLAVPGFVTDVLGLVFLLPPARPWARRMLQAWAGRGVVRDGPPTVRGGAGRVVEGEVVEPERGPDDEDRPRPGG
ncbi:MAG TPA: FxsA family protein [Actinomycetales bacterium]|nr:FxsA family protein [Actinomycetales bacterium]